MTIFGACRQRFCKDTPVFSPPSFQPIKLSENKCDLNSVKLNSRAVSLYHVAHDMLLVMSARCVARDVYTIAPSPGHLSVRVGDISRRNEEIVKILNCAFQCNHNHHRHHHHHHQSWKRSQTCRSQGRRLTTRPPRRCG